MDWHEILYLYFYNIFFKDLKKISSTEQVVSEIETSFRCPTISPALLSRVTVKKIAF